MNTIRIFYNIQNIFQQIFESPKTTESLNCVRFLKTRKKVIFRIRSLIITFDISDRVEIHVLYKFIK